MRHTFTSLFGLIFALLMCSCGTLAGPPCGLLTGGSSLCHRVWGDDCSPSAQVASAVPLWLVGTTVGPFIGLRNGIEGDLYGFSWGHLLAPFPRTSSSNAPVLHPAGTYTNPRS